MHGLIFAELKKYAETKHGKGTWQALLKKAGLETKIYLAIREYPDAELVALVAAASSMTGLPVPEVLEDFGEFIVPDLVTMYGHLLRPEWGAIDVIENTEGTVHSVVRVKNPGAKPPELRTERHGANEVVCSTRLPGRCVLLPSALARGWQNTSTRTSSLNRRRACTRARPNVKLCSVSWNRRPCLKTSRHAIFKLHRTEFVAFQSTKHLGAWS
jgi:Haem-NO-binding